MPDSNAAQPFSKTAWPMLLPWLEEYRSGPSILASDELIPNAWLDGSPAEALNANNFRRFCELVALRHVTDRADITLADDFPTVSGGTPVAALELEPDAVSALHDNSIRDVSNVLTHSAGHLLHLPGVGRAIVIDVVAALVAEATRAPHGEDNRSGGRVLADPHLLEFIESVDERDRVILHERIFAAKPRTQADLAKELGLSRERVNQLDRSLRLQLSETVESSVDLRRFSPRRWHWPIRWRTLPGWPRPCHSSPPRYPRSGSPWDSCSSPDRTTLPAWTDGSSAEPPRRSPTLSKTSSMRTRVRRRWSRSASWPRN
ncbi:sigma factor-like helix-turn-helix DNA-binding protein [Williamsia sp. D3]|uniref:sigma factor-like helix-turn-helix DNA-binding protein n=1 Tax=Williamsia sp. D3 TaxID=1313067 RepID=UPI0004277843|nr:sigma factor-like helix-turn-helix DNA-binding protein [Williamsia sp. D3]